LPPRENFRGVSSELTEVFTRRFRPVIAKSIYKCMQLVQSEEY
jgi:hypothetical protein